MNIPIIRHRCSAPYTSPTQVLPFHSPFPSVHALIASLYCCRSNRYNSVRPSATSKYSFSPDLTSSSRSISADPGNRFSFSSSKYSSMIMLAGFGAGRGMSERFLVTSSQSSTRRDLMKSGTGILIIGRLWKVSSYSPPQLTLLSSIFHNTVPKPCKSYRPAIG